MIGVDIRPDYVKELNQRHLASVEPGVSDALSSSRNFRATIDLNEVLTDDLCTIFVHVSTTAVAEGYYDCSQLDEVISALCRNGRRTSTIDLIIGSTVMPGYCEALSEKMAPLNYSVSYNPEFIAQGSIMTDMANPDFVLIGEADKKSGDKIEFLNRKICENSPQVCRMDPKSAEIAKLALNCFLTTKIAFANAIGDLAIKSGATSEKILSAIGSDNRVGHRFLAYGFGYGGSCLPRDNGALHYFAQEMGYPLLLSDATDKANKLHLEFQCEHMLAQYSKDEPISFDHVSYKKGALSLEQSHQLLLALKLARAGRKVHIREHPEIINQLKARYGDLFEYETIHAHT